MISPTEVAFAVFGLGMFVLAVHQYVRVSEWKARALALESEKQKAEQERDMYKGCLGVLHAAAERLNDMRVRIPSLSQVAMRDDDEWPDEIG